MRDVALLAHQQTLALSPDSEYNARQRGTGTGFAHIAVVRAPVNHYGANSWQYLGKRRRR